MASSHKEILQAGFKDVHEYAIMCRYKNCSHGPKEKECAVSKAVEEGQLRISRVSSYREFIASSSSKNFHKIKRAK